jgi:hypothetical protein
VSETKLLIQRPDVGSSGFFAGKNSGWTFARHAAFNDVTAILPPKREVDFAYFGY